MKNDKTQAVLADYMGISLSALNAKINEADGREFKQNEIIFIRDRYGLSEQELIAVFFSPEVSEKDTQDNKTPITDTTTGAPSEAPGEGVMV